jgi:hypothetical protein
MVFFVNFPRPKQTRDRAVYKCFKDQRIPAISMDVRIRILLVRIFESAPHKTGSRARGVPNSDQQKFVTIVDVESRKRVF